MPDLTKCLPISDLVLLWCFSVGSLVLLWWFLERCQRRCSYSKPWASSFPFDRTHRPEAVHSKESYSPPESGAAAPKNHSQLFHPSEFGEQHQGLTSNTAGRPAPTGELVPACQRRMFSTLVQALHQFRILTGASSSPVAAKSRDGGGGCTRKSWVVPFHHQSRGPALGWRQERGRINELCRRQNFGWMACCASQRIFASASPSDCFISAGMRMHP